MDKILTISIAAYNVQDYLEETLESLSDERYRNEIEVLIVDDGSKDNTGLIAQKYQQKYPDTFIYVKKENGGHGSTINRGMKLATGKYFRIIDGDDYVNKDAFFDYIKKLKTATTDIVLTDFRVVNSKGDVKVDPAVIENGVNPFDLLKADNVYSFDTPFNTRVFGLSSLTIKTSLLQANEVFITEKCFYVDVEFIIWCINLSQNYIYHDYPVYMYRKEDNGNNSVNKANMMKNVGMQETVALKLCSLYEKFITADDNKVKMNVIRDRIAISVGALYRTYMLMDKKMAVTNIKRIDRQIKNDYPNIFMALDENRFIHFVRFMNYVLIGAIRIVYKEYIRRK